MNADIQAQVTIDCPVGSRICVRMRGDGTEETVLRGRVVKIDASGVLLEEGGEQLHALDWASIEELYPDRPSESALETVQQKPVGARPESAPRHTGPSLWYPPAVRPATGKPWSTRSDPYRRAKEAEHYSKDPVQFEHWLRVTIDQGGRDLPSAVKDLAWLLAGQARYPDALALLTKHRAAFADLQRDAMENLHIQILGRSSDFTGAAELCDRFAIRAAPERLISLRRQKAVLLRAAGDLVGAAEAAREVLRSRPKDAPTAELIEQMAGDALAPEVTTADLSEMARFLLRNGSRLGLSSEALGRGIYEAADILRVQARLSITSEALPKVRGDLFLTQAWLCFEAPEAASRHNPLKLLRQAFLCFARAALEDRLPDTARAFASEVLVLLARENVNVIDSPLAIIAATYLPAGDEPEPAARGNETLTAVLARIALDPAAHRRMTSDLVSYAAQSQHVIDAVISRSRRLPELAQLLPQENELRVEWHRERKRLRDETVKLDALRDHPVAVDEFPSVASQLRLAASGTRFDTDRGYLLELADLLDAATVDERNRERPADVLSVHDKVEEQLAVMVDRITAQPTRLAVEQILPILESARGGIQSHRGDLVARARPILRLRNLLEQDYCVQHPDGSVLIPLELSSDEGGIPVEDLRVAVQNAPRLKSMQPVFLDGPLRGGEARELNIRLTLEHALSEPTTLLLPSRVQYRLPLTHEEGKSDEYQFDVRVPVRPAAAFQMIAKNPYSRYTAGGAVSDADMFFGRADLLREIAEHLSSGPLGHCVVLHGEGRCGKSSVMHQLEQQLSPACLVVRMSLEAYTPKVFTRTLVENCVEKLRFVAKRACISMDDWPSAERIAEDPLGALMFTMRNLRAATDVAGRHNRIILLLDEFGYVHLHIRNGDLSAGFMDQWRGMLESELFSAVVAGKDTMVDFRREYWPAFARSLMYRLTYLSTSEAGELAQRPLPLEDRGRYRGRALDRMFELTLGHPFFMQLLCDSIVRTLNAERAVFVTEHHVDMALAALVRGRHRLPTEKFEPLIASANPSGVPQTSAAIFASLAQIARGSLTRHDQPNDENVSASLNALRDKEVVSRGHDGRVTIRMKLFEEWLKAIPDYES